MLIRSNGGESGIKEYLEVGQTKSRFYNRDQLDYRLILDGDIGIMNSIISNIDNNGEKYHHFTLSFKEDNISSEVLQKINNEFKEFVTQEYTDNEIYFYSEAHLPKIKSYIAKNGNLIERKPHIHVIIPRYNLFTAGPIEFRNTDIEHYFTAFQEYINQKYSLASPKENIRDFNKYNEVISRHKSDIFDGHYKEIKQKILQIILEKNITNTQQFDESLRNDFNANVNYIKGKTQNYFQIKLPQNQKNIRLKDYVFSDDFISLNTKGKNDKIREIAKKNIVYIDIGFEKKIDKKNLDLLVQWKLNGALLQKYWNQFSKYDKTKFTKMEMSEKLKFLNQKKENYYRKVEEKNVIIRESNTREYNGIIAKYIQSIAHNIEAAGDNIKRISGIKISVTAARRRANEHRRKNIGKVQENRSGFDTDWEQFKFNDRAYKPRISQEVIDKLIYKMENEDWVVKNNKQIEEIKKKLNASTVLELLSITHGVVPDKFKIIIGDDEVERIICGNRKYNVVDFLFKEMNFSWNETKDMLSIAIKMQLDVDRERGYNIQDAKYLWDEYQIWFDNYKNEIEANFNKYKLDYKELKANIRQWYIAENNRISKKYEGFFHRINQEKQKIRAERVIRENRLKETRIAEYQKLKSQINLKIQDAYRDFLLQKANINNDNIALRELRRLRLDFDEYDKQGSIRQTEIYHEHKLSIKFLMDKNGFINYLDSDKVFIKDTGHRIDIIYSNEENIGFIVDLSIKKYGKFVSLDGSEEFKKFFIEYCVNNNIEMKYNDKWSQQYLEKYRSQQLEKNRLSDANSKNLNFTNLILADVITINKTDSAGILEKSLSVKLIDKDTNEVINLSGSYLKNLDKLSHGALIDLSIILNNDEDKTKITIKVKDHNYLKTLNSNYLIPMEVIDINNGKLICNYKTKEKMPIKIDELNNELLVKTSADNTKQVTVENSNTLILPGDKIISKIVITESGLERQVYRVIDSEQKKRLVADILKEDCKQIADNLKHSSGANSKIYQIAGKYINSGYGIDPFYKTSSFYILLKDSEGKLKSIWGKELSKLVQQKKLQNSKQYIITKINNLNKYSISEVENFTQRVYMKAIDTLENNQINL